MAREISRPKRPTFASIQGRKLPISELVDEFFHWMSERHSIHQCRLAGERIWTKDPILQEFKFTNLFRIFDRNTQFILQQVIQEGPCDLVETCFRVILFRMFNRIETWELLSRRLGQLTWKGFDLRSYDRVLRSVAVVHGHAYFIPAPKLGGEDNIANHLRLIYMLMELGLPKQLMEFYHMQDAFEYIRLFPGLGDFTGFQLLLDLNITDHFNFSEDEWAACGPGSSDGLQKIFSNKVKGVESEAMLYLHEHQHEYWQRLSLEPPLMHPTRTGVSVVDIEHALCEFEKYCRKKHPEVRGRRTNIKQRFVVSKLPYTGDLPKKWTRQQKVVEDTPPPPPIMDGDRTYYEVSHIIAESGKRFLVRWVGYKPIDDTWENAENLSNGAESVLAAWRAKKQAIEDMTVNIREQVQFSQRPVKRNRSDDTQASQPDSSLKRKKIASMEEL